jgi:hypothetical protein
MKRGMLVSVLSLVGLAAVPAGAQTLPPPAPAGQMQQFPQLEPPPPYAPPRADGQPLPLGVEQPDDVQRSIDASQVVVQPQAQGYGYDSYDPAAAEYAPDLGPDNDIAQTYDDGYDPQAYTQFQTALAPYGSWDYDDSYGYVWTPAASIVGGGFVPYGSCGHWIRSEYGWTWVSDWNWGWAPFHYGRWITRGARWSWVPGTMWGPAWVSWRSGNGYVGWAPLPPRGLQLAGWYGGRTPWRFTLAASLAAPRLSFVATNYIPSMFARTTVVSNDRLLLHGRYTVHVNAGPVRGITAPPVTLSRAAPGVLPHVAVYPHAGVPTYARPWVRGPQAQRDPLTKGWHAGTPLVSSQAPAGHSVAPMGSTYGGYARPIGASTAVVHPAPGAGAPVYGRPAPTFGGRPSAGAFVAPRPAYQPPAIRSYTPVARTYGAAPVMNGGTRAYGGAPASAGYTHFTPAPAASAGYHSYGGAPAAPAGGGYHAFGGAPAPAGGGYHFGGAPAGGGFSHPAPAPSGGFGHFGGGAPNFGGGGAPHFGGGGGAPHFGGGGGGHHR